ncbi:MAG: fibronectin type III domain-containing protein [Patescibacteria group bacterium]|nr:fibronectin type III domain-containing protein [Patescibacteria group bacterium]
MKKSKTLSNTIKKIAALCSVLVLSLAIFYCFKHFSVLDIFTSREQDGVVEGEDSFNIVASVNTYLAEPLIESEPGYTRGTTNTIIWNSVVNADFYQIQRSSFPNFAVVLQDETPISTEYTFTNLLSGAKYYYRVRAVAVEGFSSEWSNVVFSVQDDEAPASEVTGVDTEGNVLEVQFSASDTISGVANIYLYMKEEGGSWVCLGMYIPVGPIEISKSLFETGKKYDLTTIGLDNAGNVENLAGKEGYLVDMTESPQEEPPVEDPPPEDPVGQPDSDEDEDEDEDEDGGEDEGPEAEPIQDLIIQGNAFPFAEIVVYDDAFNILSRIIADKNGQFSIDLSGILMLGDNIRIRVRDSVTGLFTISSYEVTTEDIDRSVLNVIAPPILQVKRVISLLGISLNKYNGSGIRDAVLHVYPHMEEDLVLAAETSETGGWSRYKVNIPYRALCQFVSNSSDECEIYDQFTCFDNTRVLVARTLYDGEYSEDSNIANFSYSPNYIWELIILVVVIVLLLFRIRKYKVSKKNFLRHLSEGVSEEVSEGD